MDEPVVLHSHDPIWLALFAEEQSAIVAALGVPRSSILHVGSTAIPGLAAKPIIDILIEAAAYPPDATMVNALSNLGYEHLGECGVSGRHWFRKGRPRTHHVHLVPVGGEVGRRLRLLRDWLLDHPEDAREYERVKRQAALGRTINSKEYANAKTEVIERILARARQR